MSNKAKLLALAESVEKLTGPDTDVDAEIALATNYALCRRRTTTDYPKTPIENQYGHGIFPPSYTASFDAAMRLVPEGWAIDRISMWPATPEGADNVTAAQSHASMVGTSLERFGKRMIWCHGGKDGRAEANATTPALALTAACLRAQAGTLA